MAPGSRLVSADGSLAEHAMQNTQCSSQVSWDMLTLSYHVLKAMAIMLHSASSRALPRTTFNGC